MVPLRDVDHISANQSRGEASAARPRVHAFVISAGQGRRMLPLTSQTPKCLLPVLGGRSILELQLQALAECGIADVTVMAGFGADQVERCVRTHTPRGMRSHCLYNPFFAVSDNLITAWLARGEMRGDIVLLNGDTLFEPELLRRLLSSPRAPVRLAVDMKDEYDADDMKISLGPDGRVAAVSKTLDPPRVDGESIGLMSFQDDGVEMFRRALDDAVRDPQNFHAWYLTVVDTLSRKLAVETLLVDGLWWGEVDAIEDLESVRGGLANLGGTVFPTRPFEGAPDFRPLLRTIRETRP